MSERKVAAACGSHVRHSHMTLQGLLSPSQRNSDYLEVIGVSKAEVLCEQTVRGFPLSHWDTASKLLSGQPVPP